MYALIDPNGYEQYISSWEAIPDTKWFAPVYSKIWQRVCQVEPEQFPVSAPLFWFLCADNVVADQYYFDATTQTIIATPQDAPNPNPEPVFSDPKSTGVQAA